MRTPRLAMVAVAFALAISAQAATPFMATLWSLGDGGALVQTQLSLEQSKEVAAGLPRLAEDVPVETVPFDWLAVGVQSSEGAGLFWVGWTWELRCPTLELRPLPVSAPGPPLGSGAGMYGVCAESFGRGPLRATAILLNNAVTQFQESTAVSRLESPAMEVTRAGVLCWPFDPHNGVVFVEGNGAAWGCFQVPRVACGLDDVVEG